MSIQPVAGIVSSNTISNAERKKIEQKVEQQIENRKKAEEAKAKPREERTLNDEWAILNNALNSIPEPVVAHANAGHKLNYLA